MQTLTLARTIKFMSFALLAITAFVFARPAFADQIPVVKQAVDAAWQTIWVVAGTVFAIIFVATMAGVAVRKLSWTAALWVLGCTVAAGAVTRLIQWGMSFGQGA